MQKPGDPKISMPEQHEPLDELYCWGDRDRVCGADCVMYEDPAGKQHCVAVKAAQQIASALTVTARTLQSSGSLMKAMPTRQP